MLVPGVVNVWYVNKESCVIVPPVPRGAPAYLIITMPAPPDEAAFPPCPLVPEYPVKDTDTAAAAVPFVGPLLPLVVDIARATEVFV